MALANSAPQIIAQEIPKGISLPDHSQTSQLTGRPQISLEQYDSEAGPDYAAWSRGFNMHVGYYHFGANPLDREAMLERMNAQVLSHLQLEGITNPRVLDLGCGLGATLRSFASRLPGSTLLGVTPVPWQVEHARILNNAAGCAESVRVIKGDYEDPALLANASFDGIYALESSCYASGADKATFLAQAHRLLRPGGRLVVADGFLTSAGFNNTLQERIYRKVCDCWVLEDFAHLDDFTARLDALGFKEITVEHLQMRVAPSVAHIPWVTMKFLVTDVVFGQRAMTRARWNNVLAPVLLPLVSAPLGPLTYCMITAKKI